MFFLTTARECGQQHDPCCDLPEDIWDFDGELYRPTQAVWHQTTEQLAIPDSLSVRSTITFVCSAPSLLHFVLEFYYKKFKFSIFISGQAIESLCTVWTDIRTSSTLWPQEGRMACSVSGTWDKATHPSHSWRHTLLKVRLYFSRWFDFAMADVFSLQGPLLCFISNVLMFFSGLLHSVGSPLPPIQPRSSVHMLRGWFTAALGDFLTFRHALLLTRQVKCLCLYFSWASREILHSVFQRKDCKVLLRNSNLLQNRM